MRHRHRGLAATLVLAACLGACSSSEERAPVSTPSVAASAAVPATLQTTTSPRVAPTTVEATTTEATSTTQAPTSTTIGLAPDQQPERTEEIRMLLASVPATAADDADTAAARASVEGALARVSDGTITPGDYFLAAGDYLPAGMVIQSYLVCPTSLGERCAATLADYQEFVAADCPGIPLITSLVEGPSGPVGAGTCLWRPAPEQIEAAEDVVRDALVAVVADTAHGVMSQAQPAAVAAQAYADFVAPNPLEDPLTSDLDGAAEVRRSIQSFYEHGFTCSLTWFDDPVDDGDRERSRAAVAASITTSVEQMTEGSAASFPTGVGVGSAIGSGRLVVTWCVAVRA